MLNYYLNKYTCALNFCSSIKYVFSVSVHQVAAFVKFHTYLL